MTAEEADDALPRWRDPKWQAEILGWAADALARHGRSLIGEAEQVKARPWSTIFRLPTDDGHAWLKGNAEGSRYEAALVDSLARWVPEHVATPLAIDAGRGWLLLPDGGPTLRARAESEGHQVDLPGWERMLVEHAALQRGLEDRVHDLLRLGVPDQRTERLPQVRAALLPEPDDLRQQALRRMCASLDASGVRPTLEHDDLHDNNVFADAASSGTLRVFDWGDAVVAHPFLVLRVALGSVAESLDLAAGGPEIERLRDAYLEAWTDVAPLPDLRETARVAVRVATVVRAAGYRRALLEATPTGLARWEPAIGEWLGTLEGPTPLESEPSLLSGGDA